MSDTQPTCRDCGQAGTPDNQVKTMSPTATEFYHEQGTTGCIRALREATARAQADIDVILAKREGTETETAQPKAELEFLD